MKRLLLVTLAVTLAGMGARVYSLRDARDSQGFAHPFTVTNGVEASLMLHDGQAYAALAQDPALEHPSLFNGDRQAQAFRAGRPALPYLTWILSVGQPGLVPYVLLVLSVLGVVLMLASAGTLLISYGRDPWQARWILGLPATLAVILFVGLTDAWAVAALLAALTLWRDARIGWAVVLLTIAVLFRETSLFALPALMVVDRRAAWLLPGVVYTAWVTIVTLRVGTFPYGSGSTNDPSGTRYGLPFAGIAERVTSWDLAMWLGVLTTVGLSVVAWRWMTREVRVFTSVWWLAAICMGSSVWRQVFDVPRVMLPVSVVAVLAIQSPVLT